MISVIKGFLTQYKKYAPVLFFIGGFIWDSITLGRIDSWYSTTILFLYLMALSLSIYMYNLAEDGKWKHTILEPYQEYMPLAIQFFLGGLCSAYVIFFFQSVSLTKTVVFFVLLLGLLFSNELLKHRVANKYLQFGAYFFVNFTFFIFFLPIIFGVMNTFIFFLSGLISLATTLWLILYIYRQSPSTQKEINKTGMAALIFGIYLFVNICYTYNLIPPVPLSLKEGFVAYNVERDKDAFLVSYERGALYPIWKTFNSTFKYSQGDTVFVYTSIFAPSDLQKSVYHKWKWFNPKTEQWNITDRVGYQVSGGREGGFRGFTFKENIWPGLWQVDVITKEGLVLGKIDFTIIRDTNFDKTRLTRQKFE